MDGELSWGNCEDSTPKKVEVTIKRPWWAFWQKDKVITIPNATISFGDIDITNDVVSVDLSIKGE